MNARVRIAGKTSPKARFCQCCGREVEPVMRIEAISAPQQAAGADRLRHRPLCGTPGAAEAWSFLDPLHSHSPLLLFVDRTRSVDPQPITAGQRIAEELFEGAPVR
jgi:hypothetical protein